MLAAQREHRIVHQRCQTPARPVPELLCLSSWAGQLAEVQRHRGTGRTHASHARPQRRRPQVALLPRRVPALGPCRLLGARTWTGLWPARQGQEGSRSGVRVSRSHPRSVGSAGTRAPASSSSTTRRARAGCCCTRRPTLALNPRPSPSPGPNPSRSPSPSPSPSPSSNPNCPAR